MIRQGIVNPQILSLLARVRHTNMLVIADRGFPFWPGVETVDISLCENVPTVLEVLNAILANFDIVQALMAEEFLDENLPETQDRFASAMGVKITYIPHIELKKRVPDAIGLIRTGDAIQYANVVLVSGRPEE